MTITRRCRVCFDVATHEGDHGYFCDKHAPEGAKYWGPTEASPEEIEEIQVDEFRVKGGPTLIRHSNVTFIQNQEKRAADQMAVSRTKFNARSTELCMRALHSITICVDEKGEVQLAFMTMGDRLTLLGLLEVARDTVLRHAS